MVVNKKADTEYVLAEERKYLGAEIGDPFIEPENQISGYESIKVELLSPAGPEAYKEWVNAAFYTALCTWDSEPQNPVSMMHKKYSFEEKERMLMGILRERPISVALEGVCFNFKVTGAPRSLVFQVVRHRDMSFGQESFRVSSCYACSVRAPQVLFDAAKDNDRQAISLLAEYESVVRQCRYMYKRLIQNGVPREMARNIMPMGTTTKIGIQTQLAFLIKYIGSRTVDITMDEHTLLVCLMLKEIKDKQPKFYDFLLWYTADKKTGRTFEVAMKQYLG